MNIIKPLHLTVLHKSFSYLEKDIFAVSIPIGYSLSTGEIQLEQKLWENISEQLGDEIFDAAMPKDVGEVLVAGNFIAPNGHEVEAGAVRLTIESKDKQGVYQKVVDKELAIFGDRYWHKLLGAGISPSSPKPFSEMPIRYENAFGGEEFKQNPEGKGIEEIETDFGMRQYLPNIEYKSKLITSPGAKPNPASLGRIDIMNSPRLEKAGTYDQKYIDTRMPGLPDDINWRYFNDAAEDQWLDGFFKGDEKYQITNMHTVHRNLSGTLPPIYGRAFVNQETPIIDEQGKKTGETEIQFKEIKTKLDTLYLFPNADLGVMVYRGTLEAYSDIGADIKALLLACENQNDTPRSLAHYQNQLIKRIDLEHGYKYALFSAPLIAEGMKCGFQQIQDEYDFPLEMLGKANMDEFAENKKQEAFGQVEDAKTKLIEQCKEAGVDPTPYLEKINNPEKPPEQIKIEEMLERMAPGMVIDPKNIDIFNMDLSVMDEIKAYQEELAEKAKEQAKQKIKEEMEKLKQESLTNDLAEVISEMEKKVQEIDLPPMWPRTGIKTQIIELKEKVSAAKQQIEFFRKQGASEDQLPVIDIDYIELQNKLEQAEVKLKGAYLTGAHLLGEMRSPHLEKENELRQMFLTKFKSGESLLESDFACIDLAGEDLTGIDLSGCYLEGVNFSNCNLTGANLSKAILAGANLQDSILIDANCEGANIGAANLTNADFTNANLTKCQLGGSNFTNTKLINCPMAEGNFLDTKFENTNFNNSDLSKCNFVNPIFIKCIFTNSNLTEANFVEGQFNDCEFNAAKLNGANFVTAQAANNQFENAEMINVRFVGGCELSGCNFTKANVSKSCFRENHLVDAIFDFALLDEADFSSSELKNASFHGASAYRTQFMASSCKNTNFNAINLMEGSMYKAYAVGADFSKANLYCVNFLDSTLGQNKYKGANLDQTILKDWRP